MNNVKEALESLYNYIDLILTKKESITDTTTWNDYLEAMEKGLEVFKYINNNQATTHEYYVAREIGKELLKYGIHNPVVDIKSYKRQRLFMLTEQVKQEFTKFPYGHEEKLFTNIDELIRSLQIFKLDGKYLSMDIYENSYEIYSDIRGILLKRKQPIYKKIYINKVVDILDSNIRNIKIENSDQELLQMIKLIKGNPEFNYENSILGYITANQYEVDFVKNRLKRLIMD